MGFDFEGLVHGEDSRVERDRGRVRDFALILLAGAVSMVITLAIHRPECLGPQFLQCISESSTVVPFMLLGIVVAGTYGGFVLWTTRRDDSILSSQALAWGVAPVIALGIGAAVGVPLLLGPFFYPPAIVMVVTVIAAVGSIRALRGIWRGRREPTSVAATVVPGVAPLMTTTLPSSVPLRWLAHFLRMAPLGLLFVIMSGGTCFVSGDVIGCIPAPTTVASFLILSSFPYALSFAAYRVVRRGGSVARGFVIGAALVIFLVWGFLGGALLAEREHIFGFGSGGIVLLAIAFAGIGAIVWYFVKPERGSIC